VLTADLPGVELRAPAAPMDASRWAAFVPQLQLHRQTERLLLLAEADRWPLTERQRQHLRTIAREAAVSCVELDRELVRTIDRLHGRHGLTVRVLKGAAYAHTLHPRSTLRSYVDIDLLVPSDEFERAREALTSAGARRGYAEPRPGFDRRFGKGGTFITAAGIGLDLHRTLATGVFGLTVDERDLFAAPTTFTVAGRELAALSLENMVLHACLTVGLENAVRLDHLRDLAELLHRSAGAHEVVVERARRWQVEAVVARAVRRVTDELGVREPAVWSAWAAAYEPTRRDRRRLAPYVGAGASYAGQTLVALEAIPGLRRRVSYVWAMAAPAPGTGRARGVRRLRTAGRSLWAWRPTSAR